VNSSNHQPTLTDPDSADTRPNGSGPADRPSEEFFWDLSICGVVIRVERDSKVRGQAALQTQEVGNMSQSVLSMSMSLDGYIAGPNDTPDNPGGDGFKRLHEWLGFASDPAPTTALQDPSGPGRQFLNEINATGAVLSGRNTV
jgi:hypothetical protein